VKKAIIVLGDCPSNAQLGDMETFRGSRRPSVQVCAIEGITALKVVPVHPNFLAQLENMEARLAYQTVIVQEIVFLVMIAKKHPRASMDNAYLCHTRHIRSLQRNLENKGVLCRLRNA